ncbi:MAG: ribonuclease Y [Clostridia bacterium]|nr:ribonuclease Y [Clostridia bacterium]
MLGAISISSILAIVLPIIALAVGFGGGYFLTRFIDNKKLKNNKEQANKILEDAYAQAKNIKQQNLKQTNDEILLLKSTFEEENRQRREEARRSEERIAQRENSLEKREEALDKKLEAIDQQKEKLVENEQELKQKFVQADELKAQIVTKLEEISGYSKEQAKQEIIEKYTQEAKIESAKAIKEIEEQTKNEADKIARIIITLSIQKCAVDQASESTVSVVSLPSEEMKGRIIGREGRNIRALEAATGIDLIVDDTPEAITLSGFDPIRREIARISLEKLIMDGRIHPARIEELVNKVRKDVEQTIKDAGENACFDADIHNLHPELVKTLGRLKYRTSYGQNVLNHSLEVAYIASMLATEIGANAKVAKRAGLLHDIGKAVDFEVDGTHVSIGVELARKYKESEAVIHCIASHHNDIEPQTIEAVLVQAADTISSARPGARRESLDSYVKRLENLEKIATSFDGIENAFAIQAGREVRVMVQPDQISDEQAMMLARDIAQKIENELEYPGQIKVNVIRESRFSDIAK